MPYLTTLQGERGYFSTSPLLYYHISVRISVCICPSPSPGQTAGRIWRVYAWNNFLHVAQGLTVRVCCFSCDSCRQRGFVSLDLPEGTQRLQSSLVMMSDSGRRSHQVRSVRAGAQQSLFICQINVKFGHKEPKPLSAGSTKLNYLLVSMHKVSFNLTSVFYFFHLAIETNNDLFLTCRWH